MKMFLTVSIVTIASIAATAIGQPKPEASEYLKTKGGGAVTDTADQTGRMYLGLVLQWVKQPPTGAMVVAEFENTENGAAPYLVEQPVNVAEATLTLRSPLYPCVLNNSHYNVTVKVFSDAAKTQQIGTHEQQIQFALPKRQLKTLKLRECGA